MKPLPPAPPGPAGREGLTRQLHLPRTLHRRLEHLARQGYPREACAILVGRRRGRTAWVDRIRSAENLEADGRRRYLLDPDAFVAADLAAQKEGLEVLGFWHTHPDHPPLPSETDRAAAWEGYSYLIQAVTQTGAGELRSWHLEGEIFLEEQILPNIDSKGHRPSNSPGLRDLEPSSPRAPKPSPPRALEPSSAKEP